MCTIQKPKKRFDYDAYIQGRLIGKYVVIYHDEIPDEPEIDTTEVEELQPVDLLLIAIKTDDDVQELSKVNVYKVTLNESHLKATTYNGKSNRKDLTAYKNDWIFGVKPNFPNGRAGPN